MRSFDVEIAEISVLNEGLYCVVSYGSLFPVSVACHHHYHVQEGLGLIPVPCKCCM